MTVLAVNLTGYGQPMVVNKAFVPLAIEAGIETTITSLIRYALTEKQLVIAVKEALLREDPQTGQPYNAALAEAWNQGTQRAVLTFLAKKNATPFALASALPVTVPESGPAMVSAARDQAVVTQVNVSFSQPPEGYRYAIYYDGLLVKVGNETPSSGWVNESLADIPDDDLSHTIRVLFVTPDLALTLFGPVATL
jgi:hypothetical protein